MAKSRKSIYAEKEKDFLARNLDQLRTFFTSKIKKIFIKLRQMFVKVLILNYFDPKYHICIEISAISYVIGKILCQYILDNLSWWHLVIFFFWKMIFANIQYKTYDRKLLAIVEAFKTWSHYLKTCKYQVLRLIDYNNF